MTKEWLLDPLLKRFHECMASEVAEEFLKVLLGLMAVVFVIDSDYRKHIENFHGRYLFKSKNGRIKVAAIFGGNHLEVREEAIPDPDVTILFKDYKALMNYLLTPKPDILGSMLRQEVTLEGNLNYLYKFAFMARRLQLMATAAPGR